MKKLTITELLQLAEIDDLGIDRAEIYARIKKGKLKAEKVSGKYLIPSHSVKVFLKMKCKKRDIREKAINGASKFLTNVLFAALKPVFDYVQKRQGTLLNQSQDQILDSDLLSEE